MINGNILADHVTQSLKFTHVAVAVLRYGDDFLLAKRHVHQHQGDKLEFVGGKIEWDESPKAALIREVDEELGLNINKNTITKMGRIWHHYGDKKVCLYVYQVLLNHDQYVEFQYKRTGCDGQQIGFFKKNYVLTQKENFPTANVRILTWLTLPNTITVSHQRSDFKNKTDWLDCYKKLPVGDSLFVRTKHDDHVDLVMSLMAERADLRLILSLADWQCMKDLVGFASNQLLAIRLTHDELLDLNLSVLGLPNLPIVVSCHDKDSLIKVNDLAKTHPVMAVLLSPVKSTDTHLDASPLGWKRFGELGDVSDVPVVGLGGLGPDDLLVAQRHGAISVAGIRKFINKASC